MRRREFITLLGGAAVVWPLAARSQQAMRRVAVLMGVGETDSLGQVRLNAFRQGLQQLGWADGRNVRFDIRWSGGTPERSREIAAEFVALKPDVILANGTPAVAALKQATSSIPIVFVTVNEPVVQGFIASMARPGGNSQASRWLNFRSSGNRLRRSRPWLRRLSASD